MRWLSSADGEEYRYGTERCCWLDEHQYERREPGCVRGKGFIDMLGVFAEFEINLRRERQAEGIAAAKQRGAYRNRPPQIDMEAIKRRVASGLSPTEVARELGVSRGTVYKARADMTDSV